MTKSRNSVAPHGGVSMVYDFPSTHPRARYFDQAVKAINRTVPEDFHIKINPGNKTYPGSETLEAVVEGSIDFGWINAAHLEVIDARLGAVNLPFCLGDTVMSSADARAGLLHFINDYCQPKELVALAVMRGADQIFATKDASVQQVSDLIDLKTRVAGSGIYETILTSLGAHPLAIPISHVVAAIKKGEVDCVFTSPGAWQTLFGQKFPNATHVPGLMMINYILIARKNFCAALPASVYDTIETEFAKHITDAWQDMARDDQQIFRSMTKRGASILKLQNLKPWEELTGSVHTGFGHSWPGVIDRLAEAVKADTQVMRSD